MEDSMSASRASVCEYEPTTTQSTKRSACTNDNEQSVQTVVQRHLSISESEEQESQ